MSRADRAARRPGRTTRRDRSPADPTAARTPGDRVHPGRPTIDPASDRPTRPATATGGRTPTDRQRAHPTDRSSRSLPKTPTHAAKNPDSRSRARTPARTRTGGRYRRRRLLALGGLVLVLLAGAVAGGRLLLLNAEWFRVTDVQVLAGGLDPDRVRAAAGIRPGVPLLTVDLAEVRRRVAAIPEVASVDASRSWPGTVRLTVTERTPVALAASPSGPRWVDGTGKAYELAPADAPPLPRLAATTVAPGDPATEAGLAVLASLTPALRDKLQVVEAPGPAAVTLRLADGKQVRWGSPERSERKAAVLGVLMSQRGSVYDVSAPDLPTIRR